jgi:hypothetical protein
MTETAMQKTGQSIRGLRAHDRAKYESAGGEANPRDGAAQASPARGRGWREAPGGGL